MRLKWKILLMVGIVVVILTVVVIVARWLSMHSQLRKTSVPLNELELLDKSTSTSTSSALLEASVQNQIEEKGKRQGQYLYFGSGKVFYRWGGINLGQVEATQSQLICMKDDQITPEGKRVKTSESWLDVTSLYQNLVNGYHYPQEMLLTPEQISNRVEKLSPMAVLLKDNVPMLVIFFGCNK